MRRILLNVLAVCALLAPVTADAVTDEDFQMRTTRNLLNLCTVAENDPRAKEAIHFCHGYLLGAYHYHMAESNGPEGYPRLVCFPQPGPSRDEAIAMFIEWVKARPEYLQEIPVETEFRFLVEKWPCKK